MANNSPKVQPDGLDQTYEATSASTPTLMPRTGNLFKIGNLSRSLGKALTTAAIIGSTALGATPVMAEESPTESDSHKLVGETQKEQPGKGKDQEKKHNPYELRLDLVGVKKPFESDKLPAVRASYTMLHHHGETSHIATFGAQEKIGNGAFIATEGGVTHNWFEKKTAPVGAIKFRLPIGHVFSTEGEGYVMHDFGKRTEFFGNVSADAWVADHCVKLGTHLEILRGQDHTVDVIGPHIAFALPDHSAEFQFDLNIPLNPGAQHLDSIQQGIAGRLNFIFRSLPGNHDKDKH